MDGPRLFFGLNFSGNRLLKENCSIIRAHVEDDDAIALINKGVIPIRINKGNPVIKEVIGEIESRFNLTIPDSVGDWEPLMEDSVLVAETENFSWPRSKPDKGEMLKEMKINFILYTILPLKSY